MTPILLPHESARRTHGARRIPGQLERSTVPVRHGSIAATAVRSSVAVLVALSGLVVAIAMASHVVG